MNEFVTVPQPSFVVEDQERSLKITTEMPRGEKIGLYFFGACSLILILGFLCFLLFASLGDLLNPRRAVFAIFEIVSWSGVGAILLIFFVFILIKATVKHIIEVDGQGITITVGDLGFFRSKRYAIAHIKNLRGSAYSSFGRIKLGAVKFDYGAQTVYFGQSLQEAEANMIVEIIKDKYPQLASGAK